MSHRKELQAWIISAAGPECTRRFEAPVEVPGWSRPPWIEVRPLTQRERLERESLGVCDEYSLDDDGSIKRVVRRYDAAAMARYDYEHCLVAFCLPRRSAQDDLIKWRKPEELSAEELLDLLPPELAEWLDGIIDQVNLRRPEDQQTLAAVKKR